MRQPNLRPGNTPHRVALEDAARDGRVRRKVLEIYRRADADWVQAPLVLGRAFRAARELRSHERRFVGEAVYGMIRWRRRLAFAVLGTNDAPHLALYLAWLHGEHGASPALDTELRAAGIDPRTLGEAATARIDQITDQIVRLGVRESYPDWLVRRVVDERGRDDALRLLQAMNRRAPLTVRANRLKNTREELQALLETEKVGSHVLELAPDGLRLETHLNAFGLTAFKDGRFEMQDAGSQLIAELVAPPPRGQVLDAARARAARRSRSAR